MNRFLGDVVAAARPASATVIGEFNPRGGISTKVTASWRPAQTRRPRRAG